MSTKLLNIKTFSKKKSFSTQCRSNKVKYRYKVSTHADKPDQKFK